MSLLPGKAFDPAHNPEVTGKVLSEAPNALTSDTFSARITQQVHSANRDQGYSGTCVCTEYAVAGFAAEVAHGQ